MTEIIDNSELGVSYVQFPDLYHDDAIYGIDYEIGLEIVTEGVGQLQ